MPKFNTVRKFVIWINAIAFVLDMTLGFPHWGNAAFSAFVATLFAFGIDANGHFWFEDSFMEEENKTCAVCSHVHTNENGTCAECGCEEGKKDSSSDEAAPSAEASQ